MIDFEGYNSFPASEVAAIETSNDKRDISYPWKLTVQLKSGRSYTVCYQTKTARDGMKKQLEREIDRELSGDIEEAIDRINNRLFLVQDTLRRVEGRQLRIWRQLKAILGDKIKVEEGGEK